MENGKVLACSSLLTLSKIGILKKSLLSLKKIELSNVSLKSYRMVTIYKHYILFFRSEESDYDCMVVDTEEGTAFNVMTGLCLGARTGYSLCYWKENIFVVFGGTTGTENTTSLSMGPKPQKVYGIQLLRVHDDENCKLLSCLNSHIFSDNFFHCGYPWKKRPVILEYPPHSAHTQR